MTEGAWQQLRIDRVETGREESGGRRLVLQTSDGRITCRYHDAAPGPSAVLWVFGAGGGLDGPAGGLYRRLAQRLAPEGVASLEVAYRHPANLESNVPDVLAGLDYLRSLGRTRFVLVGHSFGGAVVINAALASPDVVSVAALSSISHYTERVGDISPRPLFLGHGDADDVVPLRASEDIHKRAREPKQLVVYPGCRHGLDECREELDRDLLAWLRDQVSA